MLGSYIYATGIAICSFGFFVVGIDQWYERRGSAVLALFAGAYLWIAGLYLLFRFLGG